MDFASYRSFVRVKTSRSQPNICVDYVLSKNFSILSFKNDLDKRKQTK